MEQMQSIFIKNSGLQEKVKIKPSEIGNRIDDILTNILKQKFEGKCSYHGYIKPNSIILEEYSDGYVQTFTLNGDVIYNVKFSADICNPSIGTIIPAKVINKNKFGLLCESIDNENILEIVIARSMINSENEISLDDIDINEKINIEIMGKRYELNDRKISIVGKVVNKTTGFEVVGGGISNIKISSLKLQDSVFDHQDIDQDLDIDEKIVDINSDEENEENEDDDENEDDEIEEVEENNKDVSDDEIEVLTENDDETDDPLSDLASNASFIDDSDAELSD